MPLKTYNGFSGEQRGRSSTWLNKQYAAGLERPVRCEACLQSEGYLTAHAEDYSEPFGPHIHQYSLCYTCHMMVHCRDNAQSQWLDYISIVRAGGRFEPSPLPRGNFGRFSALFLRGGIRAIPEFPNDVQLETLLDRIHRGVA